MFLKLLTLCLFLLAGCATTETYWGNWSEWSDWEKTTTQKEFSLQVDSTPSPADLYIDDKLVGTTPAKLFLSYPILRSSRQKHECQTHRPGLECIVTKPMKDILRIGPYEPPGTKTIDKEEEEKFKEGSTTYELRLKKTGYLPKLTSLPVPYFQDSITFNLKNKPLLKISKVTVNNNVKLSFLEKLYELFYDNRFSVECEKYNFEKMFSESKPLNESFAITKSSKYDLILRVDLSIERELTLIQAQFLNPNNKAVITDNFSFSTNDFCNVIENKLDILISSITNKFLKTNS
jgi:hypothetical protein